jgi:hypothetical protein
LDPDCCGGDDVRFVMNDGVVYRAPEAAGR